VGITFAAAIGAVANTLVPRIFEGWRISKSPVAEGEWISDWRWDHEPEGQWHREIVQLDRQWGKIKLRTTFSALGDKWEAEGRLLKDVRGVHIVGSWWSIKEGATASGPFVLTTLAAHGESMYGYFGDFDDDGNAVVATWVMARDSTYLEAAKEWIAERRKPQETVAGVELPGS
jgi:hypothetical protein